MSEVIVLQPIGIARGGNAGNLQYYNLIGRDTAGQEFVMIFGMLMNYTEAFEKSLQRLVPLKLEVVSKPTEPIASNSAEIIDITEIKKEIPNAGTEQG